MNRHKSNYLIISLFIMVFYLPVQAQKTAVYYPPAAVYQQATDLYNKGLYGAAKAKFDKTVNLIADVDNDMRISAEYYSAICAVELFNDDAEQQLNRFIENHPESPYLQKIYFNLGIFKYRKKSWRSVIKYFEKVDVYELTKDHRPNIISNWVMPISKNIKLRKPKRPFLKSKSATVNIKTSPSITIPTLPIWSIITKRH